MNNKRLCPLCAGNKSKLLHKQKFANYFNHEIAICFNCSFVFVRSIPPISFYITYYTSAKAFLNRLRMFSLDRRPLYRKN